MCTKDGFEKMIANRVFDQYGRIAVRQNWKLQAGSITLDPHTSNQFGYTIDMTVTDVASRDYYHYPLAVQAVPGAQLDLRIQYRADVFDDNDIARVVEQLDRALLAMTTDPDRPLTPLGDWGPTPPAAPAPRRSEYRPPATDVESAVCDIYSQVLGVERVGVDDSFFDLGGDSLSAMRALAAINAALCSALDLRALLAAPTARGLGPALSG